MTAPPERVWVDPETLNGYDMQNSADHAEYVRADLYMAVAADLEQLRAAFRVHGEEAASLQDSCSRLKHENERLRERLEVEEREVRV